MTKEVNAFNMLHAKMKKQGCRPAFSVLCACYQSRAVTPIVYNKSTLLGAFIVYKHLLLPIWYTKE